MRALRVYEEYGLIAPQRTPSGWRCDGEAIMARHLLSTHRWQQAAPLIHTALVHFETNSSMCPDSQREPVGWRGRCCYGALVFPRAREMLKQAQDNQLEINGGPTPDAAYLVALQAIALDIRNGAAGSRRLV